MNRIVLSAVMIVACCVVGCSESLPQNQWVKNEFRLTEIKSLEDCTMTVIKRETLADPIIVVRCPQSDTSANYVVPHGKSRSRHSVQTIDETDATDIANREFDEKLAKIRQMVDELGQQVEKKKVK